MSELVQPQPALVNATGRRIVIEFTPSGVVGEHHMQLSFTGIPEGWVFVHQALCDVLKQVGQEWAKSQRAVVVPPNGVSH